MSKIKSVIIAFLFFTSACATDPQTDSTIQEQCVIDPETGACPRALQPSVQYPIDYGQAAYPEGVVYEATCFAHTGGASGWSCAAWIRVAAVTVVVTCGTDGVGALHCSIQIL